MNETRPVKGSKPRHFCRSCLKLWENPVENGDNFKRSFWKCQFSGGKSLFPEDPPPLFLVLDQVCVFVFDRLLVGDFTKRIFRFDTKDVFVRETIVISLPEDC